MLEGTRLHNIVLDGIYLALPWRHSILLGSGLMNISRVWCRSLQQVAEYRNLSIRRVWRAISSRIDFTRRDQNRKI
jgi:hypothetical protein